MYWSRLTLVILHSSIDKPDSKFHDVVEENIHDREQCNVDQRLVHVDC